LKIYRSFNLPSSKIQALVGQSSPGGPIYSLNLQFSPAHHCLHPWCGRPSSELPPRSESLSLYHTSCLQCQIPYVSDTMKYLSFSAWLILLHLMP
uniref:Uncharacterized protein n=1 Tax=Mustela putorius furo TaxID=9669 RepID=M3Z367_MUSPF